MNNIKSSKKTVGGYDPASLMEKYRDMPISLEISHILPVLAGHAPASIF